MNATPDSRRRARPQSKEEPSSGASGLSQALLVIAGGVCLFFLFAMLAAVVYSFQYAGRIFPGVSAAGVDLSALSPEEAAARLRERIIFPEAGKIVFQDGEKVWTVRPLDLGMSLDAEATAQVAYSIGRHSDPFTRLSEKLAAWYAGQDVAPLLIYNEHMAQDYLKRIAAEVDIPTVEASLKVDGTQVVVRPGQVGHTVDVQATLQQLETQMRTLSDGIVPLTASDSPPVILDAEKQAEIARQILSAPLVLQTPDAKEGDPGPWTLEPARLGAMLSIVRVQGDEGMQYQVELSKDALRTYVTSLALSLARTEANARFVFNDETHKLDVIQPAVIGRSLDVEASLLAIDEKLAKGEHTVPLVVAYTQPEIGDDVTAEKLGITQQVAQTTTYFYGSSGDRLKNIETAASRFHGVLVAPGATFSMAEIMGDVSLETGYAEALIIYGDRTIKGVGGGVCQVSTTLFRTVFFGGYPVIERYPHAYRVYYYEQNAANQVDSSMAGLDATVFVPLVDFKFKNDSEYWILMETYTNTAGRSLTWKFYSTPDGRKVDWQTTGLQNTVEPDEPQYIENPELAQGEIRQVDYEVAGADVTITRTVTRNGQTLFTDQFATHYLPWRAIYEYGPGTNFSGRNVIIR